MKVGTAASRLQSVNVCETEAGYAQRFSNDAYTLRIGEIHLADFIFSSAIGQTWPMPLLAQHLSPS